MDVEQAPPMMDRYSPLSGKNARGQILSALLYLTIVGAFGGGGYVLGNVSSLPRERQFTVYAHQYAYEPAVIRVNKGDIVKLRFVSKDVTHGFYLEGYDLDVIILPMSQTVELRHPSQPGKRELVEEVVFTANREGKFRYRCSQTCGFMHPFMLGEFIVGPNHLLPMSVGLTIGVLVAGFAVALWKGLR